MKSDLYTSYGTLSGSGGRPWNLGRATNGDLIDGRNKYYSDDGGATWTDFSGGNSGDGLYIDGNDVYMIYVNADDLYVYHCDVSANHTLAQKGSTITHAGDEIYPKGLYDDGSDLWLIYHHGEDEYTSTWVAEVYKWDSGSSDWTNVKTSPSASAYAISESDLKRVYKDGDKLFWVDPFFTSLSRLYWYDTVADTNDYENLETALADSEAFILSVYDDIVYFNNYWYMSGRNDDTSTGILVRTDDPVSTSGYETVFEERLIPVVGSGDRIWAFLHYDEVDTFNKIYMSLDGGASFYLVSDLKNRDYISMGVEVEDADSGFGFAMWSTGDFYRNAQSWLYGPGGRALVRIGNHGLVDIETDISFGLNRLLILYDDAGDTIIRAIHQDEQGTTDMRRVRLVGYEKIDLDQPVTLTYTTATGVHTIAKAAIDAIDNYLSYTVTSIPDPSITIEYQCNRLPLREVLDDLAQRIDGIWYVTPAGDVWLLKLSSQADSGISKSESSTDIGPPRYKYISREYNYIHLYGRGGIESDGDSKDTTSIAQRGKLDFIRYYAGISDLTELQSLASSLLAQDGIATPPLTVDFVIRDFDFQQPGEYMQFSFSHIDRLSSSANYTIKAVEYAAGNYATVFLTNTFIEQHERGDLERQIRYNTEEIDDIRTPSVDNDRELGSSTKNYKDIHTKSVTVYNSDGSDNIALTHDMYHISFRVTKNNAQSIPSGSYTTVEYDDEEFDNGEDYDTSTYEFTAPADGFYEFSASFLFGDTSWSAGNTGALRFIITRAAGGTDYINPGGAYKDLGVTYTRYVGLSATSSGIIELSANDTVAVEVYQNTGGAITMYASALYNWFAGRRLF